MPFLETMILPPLCLESLTSLWDSAYSLNNCNPSSASMLWLQRFFVVFLSRTANQLLCKIVTHLTEFSPSVVLDDSRLSHLSSWRCSSPWQGHRASPTLNLYLNSAQMLQHRAKDLVKVFSKIVFSKPQFDSHMPPNNHTLAIIMILN